MTVMLRNQVGVSIECKIGFSWTMLFFGFFVPLIRGDLKWSILSLIALIVSGGISWFVMPFFYNKFYIKDMLERGYYPTTEADLMALRYNGIII